MLILETERLTLHEFSTGNAAFLLELMNTPGWLQFIGDRNIRSLADARHYLETVLIPSYEQHGFGFYSTRLKSTGTPIGICGLVKRAMLSETDIGFAFLPAYMGQGYAFEAATAVAHFALNSLRLPLLLAITEPENERSIRLLEKIGLHFEQSIHLADEDLLLFTTAKPG
ncbi:GNAT family N-acetyltransferase [Hymenobacter sp. BT730]|uniref:GNAT family N-acetyltransferase n=1 Tax=Hymenobacter sp. BT730 TaxID=3063332 RepID=UPI0026E10CBA|nr:GNAT family N-acetyltransferase [Hymenobacter sp. BT730]